MRGFLYGQTEYNLLSNVNRLDEYIALAKKSSFDFLTITDSNLYGNYKFYNKCIKEGIKPIIGLEMKIIDEDLSFSNIILYAKNNNGYKNLLKITTKIKTENIDKLELISDYLNDLFIIFVFNDSFIERLFCRREFIILDEYLDNIRNMGAYIGISYTNKLSKIQINRDIEKYAIDRKINTIPVHQCKYLTNKDAKILDALTKIAGNNEKIDELDDYSFELNPLIDDRIDSLVNSINLNLFNEKILLPKYPYTKGVSSKQFLDALCHKGLEKRGKVNKEYIDRLEYELSIINKMNYNDYFLIVWDYIRYAKQNDILVGPGRGSAAGSLVAYCLGITEVDPLPNGLLFERFLNPERVSMPDIDTDFPDVDRDKVINHVKEVYGENHVCNISAFGTFQIKSSVRELAKVFKIETSRIEQIIDMIYEFGYDKLLEEYEGTELYDFLYVARGLENLPKHISTHAAGIILSDKVLEDIIPLQDGINGLLQSQLESVDLEGIGLLKMDFLGIRNLTMVAGMMKEIPNFDYNTLRNIPYDDPKVFKMLQQADTLGLFQLESAGIKNVLIRLKPTCFNDLVAVLALYRPGPMDNIDEFIKRKHGENFEYIHPDLKPILEETYGIIVYQEQIMKIAQVFAGFSLGEADVLRRAVSKKKASLLQELSNDFIKKSMQKGYSYDVAERIYDLIFKFANYGFNKSHSVAYAMLSYQMAYLKVNYFPIFMANIMNNVINDSQQMSNYIKYATGHGLVTLKPNINISSTKFIYQKNRLFIPLNAIYSIGDSVAKQIIEERNRHGLFVNYQNFKERCNFLSSSVILALIYSGACDIFGQTKKSMTNNSSKDDSVFLKFLDDTINIEDEYDFEYLKEQEFKYLGLNLEYNIFSNINRQSINKPLTFISNLRENITSFVLAEVVYFKEITTKKDQKMIMGLISDENFNQIKFTIFPSSYRENIYKNKLYLLCGSLKKDNRDELAFVINSYSIID
ncbi:MAG: DNA polymerase III subunit alpha [Anaeroplasma sp.]